MKVTNNSSLSQVGRRDATLRMKGYREVMVGLDPYNNMLDCLEEHPDKLLDTDN